MGRPLKKWPTYALGALEATVDELKELERITQGIQDSIVLGNTAEAMRDLSNVRVMALECVTNLTQAQVGKYKKQEKAAQWNRPVATEDKAAEAVTQVMATRRT